MYKLTSTMLRTVRAIKWGGVAVSEWLIVQGEQEGRLQGGNYWAKT
jgi:hypothetical protein